MRQKSNGYFDTYYRATARTLRTRLLTPLLRSRHPPEYTARGVLVGLFVALTPTIGIQMAICALIWAAVRFAIPRWNFNLIIAMAWTWVTNVVTAPPLYYMFTLTGQLMLGRWGESAGSTALYARWFERSAEAIEEGWFHKLWAHTADLFQTFGVPMFVGSIPWAIAGAWLGYVWSLRLMHRIRQIRRQRYAARLRRQRPTAEGTPAESEDVPERRRTG